MQISYVQQLQFRMQIHKKQIKDISLQGGTSPRGPQLEREAVVSVENILCLFSPVNLAVGGGLWPHSKQHIKWLARLRGP